MIEGEKKISVVMCTYNGAKYLREQIDSILAQTYPIYEFIIQDDGSTDETVSIIEAYAKVSDNIRFYPNTGAHGVNENFFSAFKKATGDYIAIADQDDIWLPHKLETQIRAIGDNLLCGGFSKPFSEDGSPVSVDMRIPNIHLIRLLFVGMIPGHTMLISKRLLDLVPQTPFIYRWRSYDAILSMTAAAYDGIIYVDELLVHQRRYVGAATYTKPVRNKFTLRNVVYALYWAVEMYVKTYSIRRAYFKELLTFLNEIDSHSRALEDAVQMSKLQLSRSFIAFFRLVLFCVKYRDCLFHAADKSQVRAVLRAMYFPVSCGIYFRWKLKHR